MKRIVQTGLFLLFLFFLGRTAQAQVGINESNPNKYSVLDLSYPSGEPKGLLVPRMDSATRKGMNSAGKISANGLLVFDDDYNRFFFYSETENKWLTLNPWRSRGGASNDVVLNTQGNVGMGTNSPGSKLSVGGNVAIGNADFADTAQVPTNSLAVQGKVGVGTSRPKKELEVKGTARATTFEGHGTIPVGGIIMWSGSVNSLPPGWALCDGSTVNGKTTPNLKGRFVAGYDPNATSYNSVGKTGGANKVKLSVGEMPKHRHTGTTNAAGKHSHSFSYHNGWAEAGGSYWQNIVTKNSSSTKSTSTNGSHKHSFNTSAVGGNEAHENRPPYYVLAFIMRVK